MTQDEIIKSWKPMVEFIAQTYGEHCEVILHDLRNLEHSIVAIENNHITGRQVGGTITDYALKIIHEKKWEDCAFIANYKGKIHGKIENIRSSTYFIKDDDGKIIAMLCMNVDLTKLSIAKNIIDNLLLNDHSTKKVDETFRKTTMIDMLNEFINDALKNYPLPPALLSMEEKREVVKELDEKGVFLIKGAVAEIAVKLDTSEQTIYRYLK